MRSFLLKILVSLTFSFVITFVGLAQKKPKVLDEKKLLRKVKREQKKLDRKYRIVVLPSIYYTPETNLAGGLSAIGVFKTNKKDSVNAKTSRIIAAGIYTLNDQIIFSVPYDVFLKEDKFRLSGQLGFFRYPFKYSGLGSDHPVDFSEDYESYFPRFRIKTVRRLKRDLYAGGQFWYQNVTMTSIKEGGLLQLEQVSGFQGGVTSGAGISVIYDSRDDQLDPKKGWFNDFSTLHNSDLFGSDFSYDSYVLDARKYLPIKTNQVLALQFFSEFHFGNPPFNQMGLMGGQVRMRGYREGIYRDKKKIETQAEFRTKIYWKFLSFVVFGGAGTVGQKVDDLGSRIFLSGGGGARIWMDKTKKIFIRLDYGVGEGTSGFYFNLGHSF